MAATTWDFRDGTTASGTHATHTYADPGTYAVSVRSTDSLGHATTKTVSVTVGVAPSDDLPDATTPDPGPATPPASAPGTGSTNPPGITPPSATNRPAPTRVVAPRALRALVGGRAVPGARGAAEIDVAEQGFDVGCTVTGTVLRACRVDVYVRAAATAARAPASVHVGTGVSKATAGAQKLRVTVRLNATGRRLLGRSRSGLKVVVKVTGTPVSGAPLHATDTARLMQQRASATIGGFADDSDRLTAAARLQLRRLAQRLGTVQEVRCIGNTTTSSSDDAYLHRLGLRRAKAVCGYLRSHGVRATWRISSRGADAPAASNRTAAGRARNRRVELRVVR